MEAAASWRCGRPTLFAPLRFAMYSVSKLMDYSASALERASAELRSALAHEAVAVKNEAEWKIYRDGWMARKNGVLTQINGVWLKPAPNEAKREAGQEVNLIKQQVEQAVAAAKIQHQIPPPPVAHAGSELPEVQFRENGFEKA